MKLKLQQKLSIYIGLSIFSISIVSSLFFYFLYSGEIQNHINNRLTFGAESVSVAACSTSPAVSPGV